jgi:hypothetical protein
MSPSFYQFHAAKIRINIRLAKKMLSCGEKRKYSPQNMRRIIALPVIQNKIRRFNRRRQSDELEHQAQYVI